MSQATDNLIRPFLFENDKLVRVVIRDGQPWFVVIDICRILGIKNHRDAVAGLDDDEKGVALTDTLGGSQDVLVVSEGGLYTIVLRSRAATTPGSTAHRFRKWVTGEVLPQIRQTGSYSPQEVLPPASEKRPFPEWPLDEMRTKKGVLIEYRMVWGLPAAQWIAPQLGFPVPPPELIDHGRQYVLTLVPMAGPA